VIHGECHAYKYLIEQRKLRGLKRIAKVPVRLLADRRLTPWAKVVYAVLEAVTTPQRLAMMSQREIARTAGTHQPMAARSLAALERFGWIEAVSRERGVATVYRVKR
jgi:DNA-binding MarR family transcriptional regulator